MSANPELRIGVEFELLLKLRHTPVNPPQDLDAFANLLVGRYNQLANATYPRMHNDIDGVYEGPDDFVEWSVTDDVTLTTD
jgi:hypothetical protein